MQQTTIQITSVNLELQLILFDACRLNILKKDQYQSSSLTLYDICESWFLGDNKQLL